MDEFWSDFSDDDFEIDNAIQKDEIDILYNLQLWLNSNNDVDFMKIFKQFVVSDKGTFVISCTAFLEAVEAAGYDYCNISLKHRTDLMCLVRAISCTQTQTLLAVPGSSTQAPR